MGSLSPSRRRRDSLDDGDSLVNSSTSIQQQPSTSTAPPIPAPSSDPINQDDDADAKEIEAMKQRVAEMEAEAAKLRELTAAAEAANNQGGSGEGDVNMTDEDREAVDSRSIYVGNVRLLLPLPSSFLSSLAGFRRGCLGETRRIRAQRGIAGEVGREWKDEG
jgi:hypothetical protein